ncbi:MAG: ABC transporter permease [Chloroflexi bacterium]|nr:MAG: ABC transporter permease [Chloroflexota bacterium]
MEGLWTRWLLRTWVVLILLFLFIPILLIFLYAFNTSNIQSWPIPGLTLKWFSSTFDDADVRTSLGLSLQVGLIATALALMLGSFAAFAIHRMMWFGREVVSLMFILPLALPGIITGISLKAFFSFDGVPLSLLTIVVGHTTFCIVVVYNNVLARLRRTRAMLAFALSFDEVIVTTFTAGAQNTLPLWIFGAIRLGQRLPEVNVVVSFVILVTIIPVVIAARLTGGGGAARVPAAR